MSVYLRNIESGAIKTIDSDSAEFHKLKDERTKDGRFPLWEQTSAPDADPKTAAAAEEVEQRGEHDRPLHDVTSDGSPQSAGSPPKGKAAASGDGE